MKSANSVDAVMDDCVDDSTRGRLVAALTDGLRRMPAEGDGEGATVVLRALEDVAGLVQKWHATGAERVKEAISASDETDGKRPNVTSIERALWRRHTDGKMGR